MSKANKTKTLLTKLDKLITSILLLLLVLIALYVSIARQLIVWVGDYKIQLATTLSETLQTPVVIGELEGSWGIFSPIIEAANIQIGDDKQNLQIDKLTIKVDVPQSILNRQLRVAAIYGDNVKLQIRENQPAFWSVGGIPRQKDPITPEIVLAQLQRFKKISVTNGTISIHSYNQPAHTFTHVNATLTHVTDEQMKLDGILYTEEDLPFVLSINAFIDPKNWQQLRASVYADVPYINWQRWLPKEITLPWDIKQLTLGGEIWATLRGRQLRSLIFDTKHNQLTVQRNQDKTVQIKDIAMKGWFNLYKQQYIGIQLEDLSFKTDNTPFKNLDLLLTRNIVDNQITWQAQANSLKIQEFIPPIIALAPLPSRAEEILKTIQPKGVIKNLNVHWYPQKPLTEQIDFSAQVENVSFNPYKDTVGAGNISGQISGGIGSGKLVLDTQDFWLFIAKIYSKPWSYQQAKATLHWSFKDNKVSIFSPLMQLKGAEGDLTGDMMIRLFPTEGIKDYMDLRVNIANGDASYTSKYIPSKADIDPKLTQWLNTAIKTGNIETGFFQYQGSLDKNTPPTAHALLLYMKPNHAQINYQAPWPAITNLEGEVFVEPSGVRVLASKGTINNSQITDITVNIPLVAKPAIDHLYLNANIDSDVNDTLHILKSAPREVSHVFKDWQGSGKLQGKLTLDIPLVSYNKPIISTSFTVTNGQLNLQYPVPPLSHISGSFLYDSRTGLSSDKVIAYTLGHSLQGNIEAIGKGDASSLLNLNGNIDLTTLANWYNKRPQTWPFKGKTPYQLQLKVADSNELNISSQFEGITFDLPAPFTKAAEQKQPFTYHMTFGDKQPTQLQLSYAHLIDAAISLNSQKQPQGELLINQGKAVFSDKSGIQVRANLNAINLKDWKSFYDKYLTVHASNSPDNVFNINLLRSLDLRIGQIYGFNIPPQQVALYLQPTGEQGWRLDLNSPSVAGRITAPQINNLPYYVNLKYLKVPKTTLSSLQKQDNSSETFTPSSIPNVDLFIHKLFLDNDLIGTINLQNTSTQQGLRFSNIAMNLKGLHVRGNLEWLFNQQTHFTGELFGKNIENILSNWGVNPTITAKSFKVIVDGSWPNNPNDFALEKFTGLLIPELNAGRLLTLDGSSTNILRVFGILNSDAITRRLRFDFSDLFKSGLSYDHFKGEFTAKQGIYQITKPFELSGPSMLMSMTGQLNMSNQQIDAVLRVGVPIGSNLSIATLAVAPPIGGAMLIVDHFLGNELMRLAAVTYNIKGDWSNPNITLGSPISR